MIIFLSFKKLYRYVSRKIKKTSKINIKNFPFDIILRKKNFALVLPMLRNVESFKKNCRRKMEKFWFNFGIFYKM